MNLQKLFFVLFFTVFLAGAVFSQANTRAASPSENQKLVRSTPAFAELILRRTEIQSELEELLISYTEEFPKVSDARYELAVLQKDLDKMLKMKPDETGKLTLALGKLLVRRAHIETEFQNLKNRFSEDHPQTKRAKRKLEIFEKSIGEIMQ